MGYELDALIGPKSVIAPAAIGLQTTCVVNLGAGMAMIPLVDALRNLHLPEAERAAAETTPPLRIDQGEELHPLIVAWCRNASQRGPVAYISAFYFGGNGGQSGVLWQGGEIVWGPDSGPNVIDEVLRRMGVKALPGADEFDTVGLYQCRKTERWAAEGSREPVARRPELMQRPRDLGAERGGTPQVAGPAPAVPEPPPPSSAVRRWLGQRIKSYERAGRGLVLEVVLGGRETDAMLRGRAIVLLREAVSQHRPNYLVFDLRGLTVHKDVYGNVLLGFMVAGRQSMGEPYTEDKVRVLATGATAAELERIFTITKLLPILGKRIYPDVESALPPAATK